VRIALVSIGIAAALVASGSATVAQAHKAGMALLAATALVVLLEVVNVVGTWTWLVDPETRIQWEAAIGVGAASLVTAVCGVLSYGPIGLVAPAGVLFTVHLVSRLTHRKKSIDEAKPEQSTVVDESVDAPGPAAESIEPVDPPTAPIELPRPVIVPAVSSGQALEQQRRPDPDEAGEDREPHAGERGEQQVDHAPKPKRRRSAAKPKSELKLKAVHREPAVREAAARVIAEFEEKSETRPTEKQLLAALRPEFPELTAHGCKVLLGYKTKSTKTPELEAVS